MWYCRHEIQFRQALFFSAASIAGAFSGLLAYGIAHMDGVGGLEGWRWIFILEGIVRTACKVQTNRADLNRSRSQSWLPSGLSGHFTTFQRPRAS